jgi:hypothetical protein
MEDGMDIGFPLIPSSGSDHYFLTYAEPGGVVDASYSVLPWSVGVGQNAETAPPYMHITDTSAHDLSQAGEAATASGFFNTTYTVNLTGAPSIEYFFGAEYDSGPSSETGGTGDSRVTLSATHATTDTSGKAQITFTVSSGTDDHFVIVSCSAVQDSTTTSCGLGDAGATAFTATTAPAPSPSPTASVQPKLPKSGGEPAGVPPSALLIAALAAEVALAIALTLRRERQTRRHA